MERELIFSKSISNRAANSQLIDPEPADLNIPLEFIRQDLPLLPELSELEVVRHFTNLSQLNYSVDTNFYPLGSCSMKYNPRAANVLASLPGFLHCHPYTAAADNQGYLACLFELQEMLKSVTGMAGASLVPMAGAQGEFVGVKMIKAYHQKQGDYHRTKIIVPDAAHGTNPASAVMAGFEVIEIPTTIKGDLDLNILEKKLGSDTAGMMLTNPSTLGIFERQIYKISEMVHEKGGLLYYDGANFNAILGRARPGDMGFDVMHLNLHKTFATPHGGGGPGGGPVLANSLLEPFLPIPIVGCQKNQDNPYFWIGIEQKPDSIGPITTFMGNAGVLLRAYIYLRMLGRKGVRRVAKYAVLNANYLMQRLQEVGYVLAFPERTAAHEFIITAEPLKKNYGITALDIAKRLLDYRCYSPTIYFPLLIPECMLIEPTETESKQQLDQFVKIMKKILDEAKHNPELLKQAPLTQVVSRLDEVKAARDLDVCFQLFNNP